MVTDLGTAGRHIKAKADSTLYTMRKADLISYIRTLEHNYNVAVDFNENQARYIESLGPLPMAHGKFEKQPHDEWYAPYYVCKICGAAMMISAADGNCVEPRVCPLCNVVFEVADDAS